MADHRALAEETAAARVTPVLSSSSTASTPTSTLAGDVVDAIVAPLGPVSPGGSHILSHSLRRMSLTGALVGVFGAER